MPEAESESSTCGGKEEDRKKKWREPEKGKGRKEGVGEEKRDWSSNRHSAGHLQFSKRGSDKQEGEISQVFHLRLPESERASWTTQVGLSASDKRCGRETASCLLLDQARSGRGEMPLLVYL